MNTLRNYFPVVFTLVLVALAALIHAFPKKPVQPAMNPDAHKGVYTFTK